MKKGEKLLAFLLAVVLCASVCPISAFALGSFGLIKTSKPTKTDYKVVAVGDSTANAHGNDDFGFYADHSFMTAPDYHADIYEMSILSHGFLGNGSKQAYPNRLASYIAARHPEYNVTFTSLAYSGMRGTEIRALLDPSFTGDSQTGNRISVELQSMANYYGISDLGELYRSEVSSADLITLDCLMNNFTSYFVKRISAVMDDDPSNDSYMQDTVASSIGSISPEIKALVDPVDAMVRTTFGSCFEDSKVTAAVETVNYVLVSCIVNFSEIVKTIRKLNPDVRLLVGGAFNPFHGKIFTVEGIPVDVPELLNTLVGVVNTYITGVDPNRFYYSYVGVPENVETFCDYMAGLDSVWDMSEGMLSRMVDEIFGVNHAVATVLCNEARAEATEQGYDISPYTCLYPADVMQFFSNVRTQGESANPVERIVVGKFVEMIDYVLYTAGVPEVDVITLANSVNGMDFTDVLSMRGTPFDELTPEQTAALWAFDLGELINGMGAHFSYNGIESKYQAAVAAYNSPLPAVTSSVQTSMTVVNNMTKIATNVRTTVKSTLKKLLSR